MSEPVNNQHTSVEESSEELYEENFEAEEDEDEDEEVPPDFFSAKSVKILTIQLKKKILKMKK
jgi:hypothetical protein